MVLTDSAPDSTSRTCLRVRATRVASSLGEADLRLFARRVEREIGALSEADTEDTRACAMEL